MKPTIDLPASLFKNFFKKNLKSEAGKPIAGFTVIEVFKKKIVKHGRLPLFHTRGVGGLLASL